MDARIILAILMVMAIVVILFAFFGRRGSPPIREVIVREEVPVAWLPWSWGYGWGGWSGTTYVDRPFPRFPWRPRDGGHGGGHPPPPPPPGPRPGPRPPAPPLPPSGGGGGRPGGRH